MHALTAPPSAEATRLYTVDEAAKQLGTGRHYVYSRIESGELSAVNLTPTAKRPKYRVRSDSLQRFIDSNTTTNANRG